jgi:hypothetical protein
MWFNEVYIKNIFVKLIFKIFTLENSKKKGHNILPKPGIRSLCLLLRSDHLVKTVFSACYIGSVEKKINGEEDQKI